MKATIISSGKIEDKAFYKTHLIDADYIICCDGGANIAYEYDFVPDLIIGDFDSINDKALEYFKSKNIEIWQFPSEKDKTDTQIAVEYVVSKGFDEVVMLSCIGSRIDHVLGNISLLYYLTKNEVKAIMMDNNNVVMMIKDSIRIFGKKGRLISLLPYTPVVKGIKTKGLYYPLDDDVMEFGNPFGISNVIIEDEAIITVKEGFLLVILSND